MEKLAKALKSHTYTARMAAGQAGFLPTRVSERWLSALISMHPPRPAHSAQNCHHVRGGRKPQGKLQRDCLGHQTGHQLALQKVVSWPLWGYDSEVWGVLRLFKMS